MIKKRGRSNALVVSASATQTHADLFIYISMFKYIYIYIHICKYAYIYICICMYMYIYFSKYVLFGCGVMVKGGGRCGRSCRCSLRSR